MNTISTESTRDILLTLLLSIFLGGCDRFLEEYSQDNTLPTTVKDYAEILYGDGYFKEESLPFAYLPLLTDDVELVSNPKNKTGEDQRRIGYGYFTWQENPELSPNNSLNSDASWLSLYKQILTANIILEALPDIKGSESEKAQLEGEAYATKLNAYFFLTNLYGQPYQPATAEKDPGVPINRHSYAEDANFPRATVRENYQEMTTAIKGALEAFARFPHSGSIFRWNELATTILASRVALYMQDWDQTIRYATAALEKNPSLYNLNTLPAPGSTGSEPFINKQNPELAFTFGFYRSSLLSPSHPFYFTASEELRSIYREGDRRYYDNKGYFISAKKINEGSGWFPQWVYKTDIVKSNEASQTGVFGYAIRTAEAYLNRAEAYAEKGEIVRALKDIHTLRLARISPEHAKIETPSTREEMIRIVHEERRRELCFEFHRWFDLRRWGRPELVHYYKSADEPDAEPEMVVLERLSPKYTLPAPTAVNASDGSLTRK